MSNAEDATASVELNDAAREIPDSVSTKRGILLKLLIYSGLLGIISVLLPNSNRVIDFLLGLPALVLGITWCHVDANQREYSLGKLMRLGLIFAFVLAFPFYLLRTRGLKGIKTLAQAILFVTAMFACMLATSFGTLFVGYLAGAWDLEL
ncbi:MAG: hypothetical protein LW720_04225 [Pirellula sp.]|jgi:hypothetical protein|nr:hypothetical protein [Pirellula sp.]